MKSTILSDITTCSPLSVNRRFGGTYHLHLQGLLATWLLAGFLLNFVLRPLRWWLYGPPKRRLTLNGLHGVISHKMVLFITTSVKTLNPTSTPLV
jgi:hypothetical protein